MSYVKNNEIQTRIALKYDSFENWTSLNPILLAGEVAFATVSADSVAGFQNQPNVIIKVGDGVNHFNDLKTVSALAADVYAWAKEASKPAYDASEIAYTDDKFVSANVQAVIAEIAAELDNLTGGTAGSGSIASQIATAINSLDVALVEAGVGEVIGGIEEIDGKIVVTKKTLDKADIPTIEMSQVNGLGAAVAGAESNAKAYAKDYADGLAGNYDAAGTAEAKASAALASAKSYADGLASNYDAAGTAETKANAALASAKTYADGLATNYDAAGAAAQALTDAKAYANGLAGNYDASGSAAKALTDAKDYADSLAGNYDAAGSAAKALTDAKSYADGLAGNYDAAGSAETKANAALASAKAYADGLAVNYDKVGSAAQALTDAKAYANGLAKNYDAAGAAATAEQNAKDYADSLAGNYDAKGAAATAESNAKSYADSLADDYDAAGSAAQALADAKTYANGLAANYDAKGSAAAAEAAAKSYADGLAGNYDPKGSAAQALADAKIDAQSRVDAAIDHLDVADEAIEGQFVVAVSEENGKINVSRGVVSAQNVVLNTTTHPETNVAVAIDNLKTSLEESNEGHIVTLIESDDTTDYAKVYTLKQGANVVGNINIPKDLVLKSGRVEDGYIVLVLNDEKNTEISIDAGNLIEYVTSGSAQGDMVVISIDADHKVTASITDGTITKAKLTASVQTSLGLADSALQKADIATGSANGTIAVEGSDVAVKGLHAIAFNGNVENLTQTAETYIVLNCGSASVNI